MDRKKSSLPQEGQLGAPCWTGKSFFFKERECIEFIYCQYYPPTRGCNFQFTSALEKRMAIHYLKSGWIGNLHPLTLKIASRGVFSNTFLLSAVYYYNTSSNVSWGPPWVTKNDHSLKMVSWGPNGPAHHPVQKLTKILCRSQEHAKLWAIIHSSSKSSQRFTRWSSAVRVLSTKTLIHWYMSHC